MVVYGATSEADVLETGAFAGVVALCEVFGVDAFEESEVLIDVDALLQVVGHLGALGHLQGSVDAVVVEALGEGAFVGQAGQFLVGLGGGSGTRYSWKAKGTSLVRLTWFSGRSRRCRWLRG